ncbi:MAG TPA: phosphoribosylformylglycinamidine cyclo-ligase, partial [Actinomycetota bacterium]|nr:phosphoribosylformylglycinamidine cyclo-ligase [Actinomycetota bacterium]
VGAYREAGVDLDAAAEAVSLIRKVASTATRPEVVEGVGGFAGLFRLDDRRLLAAAADGVGTKIEVAREVGRLDTVGIDLVAMSANDVACTGAEPLFFLDHVVTERLVPAEVAALVEGVAEGCRRAGCALLGGETAEHPGHLPEGGFDLAGFCVGIVDREAMLGPHRVRPEDALVGLRSSGLHANGFSLVRRAVVGMDLGRTPEGLDRPLGEELLEPTLVYAPFVALAARRELIRSAAHITGGGLVENVPRALPAGAGARLERPAWIPPEVFGFVARAADVAEEDMFRTFNMGLGMVLVVDRGAVGEVVDLAAEAGFQATEVGRVTGDPGVTLA